MTTEFALRDSPMSVAMATYNDKSQLAVIREQICPGATPAEMWQFLARCVALGLDPFSRQMFFIKRQTKSGPTVAHQIGIDGFRSIAERTGELVGISEPEYQGDVEISGGKHAPEIARVTVTREIRGKDREFVGTARWQEFYPGDQLGFMWQKMPWHMLGKCAEAQAMRRAFPQQMGGLSTDAEAFSIDGVLAAQEQNRAVPYQVPYVEVTDTTTGEMKQVRAGDEYARMMRDQGEDLDPIRAQAITPETTQRLEALSDDLSEVIDDASDSSTTNEGEETEPLGPQEIDYGMCMELFTAHPELNLGRPLPRLKPDAYAAWHAKFVKALEAHDDVPF
jgi:phage recombination protein Bet